MIVYLSCVLAERCKFDPVFGEMIFASIVMIGSVLLTGVLFAVVIEITDLVKRVRMK